MQHPYEETFSKAPKPEIEMGLFERSIHSKSCCMKWGEPIFLLT